MHCKTVILKIEEGRLVLTEWAAWLLDVPLTISTTGSGNLNLCHVPITFICVVPIVTHIGGVKSGLVNEVTIEYPMGWGCTVHN
jgi:hypothetical protein